MRIRPTQLKAFAEQTKEGRKLVHAYAWASGQPGASVDDASATVVVPRRDDKLEQAQFGPYGLLHLSTPEGRHYAFDYDDTGRLRQLGLAGSPSYQITYGNDGQPLELHRGDASMLRLDPLEAGGEGVTARFADGATEQMVYRQDLLFEAVDAAGGSTRIQRDDFGAVVAVVDARGNAVQYERDEDDPLGVTVIGANGTREVWASDEDSLTVHVNGELQGRVTGSEASERAEFADGHAIEIDWDDDGRPLQGRNADATVEFRYDSEGRMVAEKQGDIDILYGYDPAGNLETLTTSDGQAVRYSWDEDGLLSAVEDTDGAGFGFDYTADGVMSRLAFPNGLETRAQYQDHATGAQCSIIIKTPDSKHPVLLERAQFDARGRTVRQRLFETETALKYDAAGRLTELTDVAGSATQRFVWDAAGNRIGSNGATAAFDPSNQILQQGSERFRHDALGRMTDRTGEAGNAHYVYNGQGHLVEARTARGEIVSYAYDAFGRRIRKTCRDRVTHFLWAGQQLMREWTVEGDRQIERRDYLFVAGEFQPLAVRINGQLYCYHLDHTGTPLALTDARGAVVWRARYDAFGAVTEQAGDIRQPLRHLGQYCDDETGLHYNLFRYYDPSLGRYLTPDPLRFRSGTTNFYTYANGDPINQRDPNGHLVFLTALAVVAGAALIGGLIGGAINAATAKEGERGSAFVKGFGWGALGGAVGAAVPLIGAAAGLGATAIAGAALAADAVVAGIEACTDGSGIGGALKAGALSVGITLATLGLAKIPGVKRALGTVGKRLSRVGDKVSGRSKQLWYKLFPGRLRADRLARRQQRSVVRTVREGMQEAAQARRQYPNGIHPDHEEVFGRMARDDGAFIIVREGNPSSIKYQGQPGYTAKPVTCKAKTAKFGPDTGLVVDPTHPRQKAYWDAAEQQAQGKPKRLKEVLENRQKAEKSWADFKEHSLDVKGSGYSLSDDGQVLLDGKKIHGDYDLHGVHDVTSKQRIDYGSGVEGVGDEELAALRRKEMNEALDPTGTTEFVQHGGQDDWLPPRHPPAKKIDIGPDPPATAYTPDGDKVTLKTEDDMKEFYEQHGLEWPYPKKNY